MLVTPIGGLDIKKKVSFGDNSAVAVRRTVNHLPNSFLSCTDEFSQGCASSLKRLEKWHLFPKTQNFFRNWINDMTKMTDEALRAKERHDFINIFGGVARATVDPELAKDFAAEPELYASRLNKNRQPGLIAVFKEVASGGKKQIA